MAGATTDVGFYDENSEDLSYSDLDTFPVFLVDRAEHLRSLQLNHNLIPALPRAIGAFTNLITLDISNNSMTYLSKEIGLLQHLRTFVARNNHFDCESLPKELGMLQKLQVLNLSGNLLADFPPQIAELSLLRCLYIGANSIGSLPSDIGRLENLEILYLGGNKLTAIPAEVGELRRLVSLNLCDNRLTGLPGTLGHLSHLQSLSLHNNHITTLPQEIVSLDLVELSLRNNPLVVKFVEDLVYEPPSLLELAGRVVKVKNVRYTAADLPDNLVHYLNSAQRCVNNKCKGVYFSSRVEQVKFVDFCGKYRLPLLQYLCSPTCKRTPIVSYSESDSSSSSDEEEPVESKLKKVLLG